MMSLALASLAGFAVGVFSMVGYGSVVAFLTIVDDEKRPTSARKDEP